MRFESQPKAYAILQSSIEDLLAKKIVIVLILSAQSI